MSFLEIVLGEGRRRSEDVWNTGSASRHKVRKCLGLGAAGPRLAGNRRGEPGISKLQLLAVFRQSCAEDFIGHLYDRSILPTCTKRPPESLDLLFPGVEELFVGLGVRRLGNTQVNQVGQHGN